MLLYHGTSKHSARKILRHGFSDRSCTAKSHKFRDMAKQGIVCILSLPTRKLAEACNNNERTDGPHASLDLMIQTMHRATNPCAANTRRWFHEANRLLLSRG